MDFVALYTSWFTTWIAYKLIWWDIYKELQCITFHRYSYEQVMRSLPRYNSYRLVVLLILI